MTIYEIPIGKSNAVKYADLCAKWGMKRREVRRVLHNFSLEDDGSDYVLIRSSGGGFYRTDSVAEIRAYRREIYNKGRAIFACLKKCDRVLREKAALSDEAVQISMKNNLSYWRNRCGVSQLALVRSLREMGYKINLNALAALEKGYFQPSPALVKDLSFILDVPDYYLAEVNL